MLPSREDTCPARNHINTNLHQGYQPCEFAAPFVPFSPLWLMTLESYIVLLYCTGVECKSWISKVCLGSHAPHMFFKFKCVIIYWHVTIFCLPSKGVLPESWVQIHGRKCTYTTPQPLVSAYFPCDKQRTETQDIWRQLVESTKLL